MCIFTKILWVSSEKILFEAEMEYGVTHQYKKIKKYSPILVFYFMVKLSVRDQGHVRNGISSAF